MAVRSCLRCDAPRPDDLRWCRKCGLDFTSPPKVIERDAPARLAPAPAGPTRPFRYDKLGAGVVVFEDRLELTIGILWQKKTHTIPLHAVVGVSVEGLGGKTLIVETAGRSYAVAVGIGAAAKIRERILAAMRDARA